MSEHHAGTNDSGAAGATLKLPFGDLTDDQRAHPQALYKLLREHTPVLTGDFGAVVSRAADVREVLRLTDVYSSGVDAFSVGNERPMIPIQVDPPDHVKFRRLLDPQFSPRAVAAYEGEVRRLVNQYIDSFISDGQCEFFSQFAVPLPCTMFLNLFGLPLSELDRLIRAKDGIIRPQGDTDAEIDAARRVAAREIYAVVDEALNRHERSPSSTMLAGLLNARIDGERLSRDQVVDIGFLFVLAGLDTVTASLTVAIHFLATNRSHRQMIVDDPALIPSAIEEILRWETPVSGVPRKSTEATEINGCPIGKGEVVFVLLGSANTDETEFVDPDLVDFGRDPNRHLAFGGGIHRCLGSHLARMELRVALEEWHRRIPDYRVPDGETPRFSMGIRSVEYLPLEFAPGGPRESR